MADIPLEENIIILSQQVSVTESFLVRDRRLCLLSLLSVGILSGLNLCRSYERFIPLNSVYLSVCLCVYYVNVNVNVGALLWRSEEGVGSTRVGVSGELTEVGAET